MKYTQEAIETGLHDAIVAQTPDVLPEVLRQVKQKEGLEHTMEATKTMPYPALAPEAASPVKKRRPKILLWAVSVAAALALVVGIFSGVLYYQTDAVVSFDVNPSVELRINSREKVISASALNADAQVVLGEMDLKGVDLEVAVNALMGSMLKNGYITADQNTVLISVESGNTARRDTLQQQLSENVQGILSQSSVQAAVLSQSLGDDEALRETAKQYDISLGKAALINLLVSQDPTLDFSQLSTLSVNDIYLLLSARQTSMEGVEAAGQPAASAYIGEAEAKRIALEHAGVAEADVIQYEIDLDFDDGRMLYEVEFKTGGAKYEYDIDAQSGAILEYKHDGGSQGGTGSQGAPGGDNGNAGGGVPANFIGVEAAQGIALDNAGFDAAFRA